MTREPSEREWRSDYRWLRRWAGGLVVAFGLALAIPGVFILLAELLGGRPHPTYRIFDHEWDAVTGWRLQFALTIWGAAYTAAGLQVLRNQRWATNAALALSLVLALAIAAICGRFNVPLPDGALWFGCAVLMLVTFRISQAADRTGATAARAHRPPGG